MLAVRLRAVAEKLLDTAERKPPTPRDPPGIFPNGIGIVLHRLSGQSPISSHARSGHNIEPDGAPSPDPVPPPSWLGWPRSPHWGHPHFV